MTYKIIFHRRADKFLAKIGKKDYDAIIQKLDELEKNPQSEKLNIKKLENCSQSYRLRVGRIRAIYQINYKDNKIFVQDIDFRGNIY